MASFADIRLLLPYLVTIAAAACYDPQPWGLRRVAPSILKYYTLDKKNEVLVARSSACSMQRRTLIDLCLAFMFIPVSLGALYHDPSQLPRSAYDYVIVGGEFFL